MKWARAFCGLLVFLVFLGFLRLRLDTDVLNLLPGDLPSVTGLKLYQRNFSNSRELILTISATNAVEAEQAARSLAETLRAAPGLVADVAWQPPWLERPQEAAELVAALWLNLAPDRIRELEGRLEPVRVRESLAELRDQLATGVSPSALGSLGYDPLGLLNLPEAVGASLASPEQGQEIFASQDGQFRLMFVQAGGEVSGYKQCTAWVEKIRKLVGQWRSGAGAIPGMEIRFTGGAAFESEIASGMERDMTGSIGMTSLIIALLFWLSHRRVLPMLWLLFLLGIILAATLALGGLVFGTINVVSLGFAGILLGLAVDYGVVHYQEALASPRATIPEIRRAIGPGIFWAAITTISAFLVLNLGGMPGLAQLGSMVAIGVGLSAFVMLFAFLPPLFRDRLSGSADSGKSPSDQNASGHSKSNVSEHGARLKDSKIWVVSAAFLILILAILLKGFPRLDQSANALRPRNSAAYAALAEIQSRLARGPEPFWLVTVAQGEQALRERLERVEPILSRAKSSGIIGQFQLPTSLCPHPSNQAGNRETIGRLIGRYPALRSAMREAGFTEEAMVMSGRVFETWKNFHAGAGIFWPTNSTSKWVLGKVFSRRPGNLLAVGMVTPSATGQMDRLNRELEQDGFMVSSWALLGSTVFERVRERMPVVVIPMLSLVLISLWLAFRRLGEILLSIGVLVVSGLALLAVMSAAGWSWNLLNLMAIPLILGSGVDYSIFMQLALRRHHGDLAAAHRSVGRALLLCGGTAVAGFGSLAWSTNSGIASLGMVCAVGIGFNMLISVFLLPVWWSAVPKGLTSPRNL